MLCEVGVFIIEFFLDEHFLEFACPDPGEEL